MQQQELKLAIVHSGHCYRCKHGALLYPAKLKDGTVIYICYECREYIRQRQRSR